MQFPESWLREFCNPPLSTQALADLLTMSGMEVEDLRPVAPPFSGIVVAQILSAEPHPQADRLRVCSVDVGSGEPLQIVCGAPNARAGLKAPLAMVGAELPPGDDGKPFKIGIGKLRGVESRGMLCSARELKIADDHGGLLELAADAPVGMDIRQHLQLDDTVFTLKLTPNLAHGLSVYGIAREVSALTGAPLKTPAFPPVQPQHDQRLPVEVLAPDLCGRFSGPRGARRGHHGPDPGLDGRAPGALRPAQRDGAGRHLELRDVRVRPAVAHLRPRQDPRQAGGALGPRRRDAEAAERQHGRRSTRRSASSPTRRASSRWPASWAATPRPCRDSTRNVYVEAAFWWPEAVAGRSRRYNFSTDAGHRFERGVDPAGTVEHIERITQLIVDICGGQAGPMDDQVLRLPEARPVTLRVARAAKVIGMPVTQAQCVEVFRGLGLQCSEGEGTVTVTPPSWRFDLKIEEDLIEEVIRVIGYDKLPSTPPVAPVTARVRTETRRGALAVQQALAALDYQETINFSFVEERWERELAGNAEPIRVLNPIAAPLAVMRSSLLGSLVAVLRHNLARKAGRVRVFELGRVFRRDAAVQDGPLAVAGVHQPMRVAGLAYGPAEPLQWAHKERGIDFFDVKGDLEALFAPRRLTFVADTHPALHPGRCARVELDGRAIGHVGELHPKWRQAYELPQAPVLFELDLGVVLERPLPVFESLPRQQAVARDLALVVREGVAHDALLACLSDDALVRSATLFDIYKPAQPVSGIADGERSLAVRLELLDADATLTDERIEAAVQAAVARVQAAFGARLRA